MLHWVELGPSNERTALVLLHGMNDSYVTWKHVAPALARDRWVLMPDLPGHGRSDRPDASYELAWHARIIAGWLERLELGPVDVVGHSFGGGVAQMLLLEPGLCVRRLVLAASGGLGTELSFVLRLATIPYALELLGQPFMALGTRLALARTGYSKGDIGETCALNMQPGSARAFGRTVRDIANWRGQRRLFYHRAHEVQQLPPIAVFWGERDRMIPAKHARELAKWAAGVAIKTFPDCSHYLHHDQPDLFASELRDFLDQHYIPRARFRMETRQPHDARSESPGPEKDPAVVARDPRRPGLTRAHPSRHR
jgi:pimeloyl-ACP methyl ester carboxylesterase